MRYSRLGLCVVLYRNRKGDDLALYLSSDISRYSGIESTETNWRFKISRLQASTKQAIQVIRQLRNCQGRADSQGGPIRNALAVVVDLCPKGRNGIKANGIVVSGACSNVR